MNIRDAYSDWSASYDLDRNLTRDLDQQVTRASLAGQHYDLVLEIGCGTGKNTLLLAEIAGHVCALDLSPGMLAQARRKVRSGRVAFLMADLASPWPCRAQSADLLVCNLVLEHIQDLAFVFSEAARVLQPGGHFFVSELHPFRQYQGSQANFQRGPQTVSIPAFIHHLSDFTAAADQSGLALVRFQEWWETADRTNLPRLVSFLFEQRA